MAKCFRAFTKRSSALLPTRMLLHVCVSNGQTTSLGMPVAGLHAQTLRCGARREPCSRIHGGLGMARAPRSCVQLPCAFFRCL
eukprot:247158-Chlamydomonas_euryale.AAC.1